MICFFLREKGILVGAKELKEIMRVAGNDNKWVNFLRQLLVSYFLIACSRKKEAFLKELLPRYVAMYGATSNR